MLRNRQKRKSNEELIQEFRKDRELFLTKDTCRVYILRVKQFAKSLNGQSLIDVTSDTLRDYIKTMKEQGLKGSTIRTAFAAIIAFYDYLQYKELIETSPASKVRKRYLREYKQEESEGRQKITIEQASTLVNSIKDTRDRAMVLLLLKSGIRINELVTLDVSDLHLEDLEVKLKKAKKRSNLLVFFDSEAKEALGYWLDKRKNNKYSDNPALFLGKHGRIKVGNAQKIIQKYAEHCGLHDPNSKDLGERFSPHCCRHFMTNVLLNKGMDTKFIEILRGDKVRGAYSTYWKPDMQEIKKEYLKYMPKLSVIG